ncbi:MAG: hypothetical protein QGH60_19520 [Phycisphaerae bacterium]|jgi:hypothetical protein|nr:hypothetical protein [Phycisphaerae bacterium]
MSHEIINATRQVDLARFLENTTLRSKIGFADPDLPEYHEDLHWEEGHEFLIPQTSPLTVRIFPRPYTANNKGPANLSDFEEVNVDPGQLLVIFPESCHIVVKSGLFIALKPSEKYKRSPKSTPGAVGDCPNMECSVREECLRISNG